MSRLAEIRARVDTASPGPWWVEGDPNERYRGLAIEAPDTTVVAQGDGSDYDEWYGVGSQAHAKFIAHAREDVPALLAVAEHVQGILSRFGVCQLCTREVGDGLAMILIAPHDPDCPMLVFADKQEQPADPRAPGGIGWDGGPGPGPGE